MDILIGFSAYLNIAIIQQFEYVLKEHINVSVVILSCH